MPNAEATAATAAAAIKRSETRTSPLPRQAPRRPAIGVCGCMVRERPFLSSQRELLVSIGSTRVGHYPVSLFAHQASIVGRGILLGRLPVPLQGQASLPPIALRRRKTKSPTATSASNLDHLVR